MRRRICQFVVSLLCFFVCAQASYAEQVKDPYHPQVNGSPITLMKDNMITQALGGRLVDLDVWFGEFFKFDDNIYNSSDKTSDTIFSTALGFKMDAIQEDSWSLRMEGQLQHNAYAEHNEYNGMEGYFHMLGNIDIAPALSVRGWVNYDNTYDTYRNYDDIFALHRASAGIGTTIKPSPFAGIDIDYQYFLQRRVDDFVDYQNYDEHSLALRPFYDITPNTTIYMQLAGAYAFPTKEQEGNARHYAKTQSFSALLGAAWKYRDTARVFAEAGYKYMYFEDQDSDYDSPVFRLGGDLALTSDWKSGLVVSYMPMYGAVTSNASNSNYLDRTQGDLYVEYSPGAGRFTARLASYYSYNEPSLDTNYHDFGASLSVSYSVTDWFNVSAGYKYSVMDYEDQAAYDRNTLTLGLAATF